MIHVRHVWMSAALIALAAAAPAARHVLPQPSWAQADPAQTGNAQQSADPRSSGAEAQVHGQSQADSPSHVTKARRGRVVWMYEALQRRYGVEAVPDARQHVLALETPEGELLPIVEDVRGQSFRIDQQLRNMDVELLVRQHARSPMIQVIRIYQIVDGAKYLVDYWCDVCSIVMFQLGRCDCCQDQNHLRTRPADE